MPTVDGELGMKTTMSSRNKRTKSRNRRSLEVDLKAVKILRTVRDGEAFYFYEGLGKPTGEIARNLSEFLDRIKSVKAESIMFHLQRRDFENWIRKTLGDSKLAGKLEAVSASNSDDIRMSICTTVEERIKELREPPVTVLADENSTVLVPSC
jgi:hypothetical protein